MPKTAIQPKCELDKFYTNPSIVPKLLKFLDKYTNEKTNFIEPSAGAGGFSNLLPKDRTVAYDISPEHPDIVQQNWFNVDTLPKDSCVVGNPPFGLRNALSKGFIQHSIKLGVEIIAFVLPMVYQKPTLQKVFPSEYKLVIDRELPRDSFLLRDEAYHVPCCFQVWIRTSDPKHRDLRFKTDFTDRNEFFKIIKVKDKAEADMFIMGSAPTKVLLPDEVGPTNRGYYIKSFIELDILRQMFIHSDWKKYGKSSANGGVFWLTTPEFLEYSNRLFTQFINNINVEINNNDD